jgi:PqqD family protein of HPr-rel-A system
VRGDLTIVELDGEAVVYDEVSGDLHHLNQTATLVFGLCDGSATGGELATEIAEAFGVPSAEVNDQVKGLLRAFRRAGLLEGPTRPAGGGDPRA